MGLVFQYVKHFLFVYLICEVKSFEWFNFLLDKSYINKYKIVCIFHMSSLTFYYKNICEKMRNTYIAVL